MNSPPIRFDPISSHVAPRIERASQTLKGAKRSKIALLGGGCALAVVLSAVLIAGFSAPDPTLTASVAPPATADSVKPPAPVANAPSVDPKPIAPAPAPKPVEATAPVKTVEAAPAAVEAPPQTTALLSSDDTRWGGSVPPTKQPALTEKPQALGPDERGGEPPVVESALVEAPDTAATAAIPVEGLRGSLDVQVAETEDEVAMLELSTGMIEAGAMTPEQPPDLRPARTAKYANLRDGPADEAKVLLVVPANSAIEAAADCEWCAVVYKGQRGYMYKSLIRRSLQEEAAAGQGLF